MLSLSLDFNLKMGENLEQQLEKLTDEKQKTAFIKQCGGEKKVLPYLQFNQWWQSISLEWHNKIPKNSAHPTKILIPVNHYDDTTYL